MEKDKFNVLIVDDEAHMRILMKKLVDSLGYNLVAEASDGEEALELFSSQKPDVVLLDIKMPIISGDKVLKEIKKVSPETCVIMLTSISDKETMELCMDIGATCYIRKSAPFYEIKSAIGTACDTFYNLKKSIAQ